MTPEQLAKFNEAFTRIFTESFTAAVEVAMEPEPETVYYQPSAEEVHKLQNHMARGPHACKKALSITNGDYDEAVQWLVKNR